MVYPAELNAKAESAKRNDHLGCYSCGAYLDYQKLLNIYGPEGLYIIAKELMIIANEDMDGAMMENIQH